jgi:hypothetical protein
MSNICPKGHFSTDQDYCSECGVAMPSAGANTPRIAPSVAAGGATTDAANGAAAGAVANGVEHCPECMTARNAGARFCEACRYDFVSRASFSTLAASAPASTPVSIPVSALAAATPSALSPSPAAPTTVAQTAPTPGHDQTHVLPLQRTNVDAVLAPAAPTGSPQRLLLRIVVDRALYTEPDPQSRFPADRPDKVFHLDLDENTLGRQFEGKGVHPEIVVHDPSISRRHLKFVRGDRGGYSVLELGSSNGSEFNGKTLEPGVMTPINPGDQLTLGMWTRIYVEAR